MWSTFMLLCNSALPRHRRRQAAKSLHIVLTGLSHYFTLHPLQGCSHFIIDHSGQCKVKHKERISSCRLQWLLEGEIAVLGKTLRGEVYWTSPNFSSDILLLLPDDPRGRTEVAMSDWISVQICKVPTYLAHKMSIHENTSGPWKDRASSCPF